MPVSLPDAFTRHQIYLEGYKAHTDSTLSYILSDMRIEISTAIVQAGVENLNELTRKELQKLISKIRTIQITRHDTFTQRTLAELRQFAAADLRMQRTIMETIEGKTVEQAHKDGDGIPLMGIAALAKTSAGNKTLWASIVNTPDPATGVKPKIIIKQFMDYLRRNFRSLVAKAWANGWSVTELVKELFGTRKLRFKDGFASKALRHGAAVLRTVLQHVSSRVQANVASMFYRFYEWMSVLDKGTTKICRTRDGIIYEYRKGPLPPAHFRCRSRAVPTKVGATYAGVPNSFSKWLRTQPDAVQADFLTATNLSRLRKGQTVKFSTKQSLTLTQFSNKVNMILLTGT